MKFKDVHVRGDKDRLQRSIRNKILSRLRQEYDLSRLSMCSIIRYLDVLIEESEFNPQTHVFYYWKFKLNYDLLSKVALDYILEHKTDFVNVKK